MFDQKDLKRFARNLPLMLASKVSCGLVKKNERKYSSSNNSKLPTHTPSDFVEKNSSRSNRLIAPRGVLSGLFLPTKDKNIEKTTLKGINSKKSDENFMNSESYRSGKAVLAGLDRNIPFEELGCTEDLRPLKDENGALVKEIEFIGYRDVVRNRMLPQDYDDDMRFISSS